MKAIKIYLAVVTVLLIGAIGFGVYIWYTVQTLDTATQTEGGSKKAVSKDASTTDTITEPIIIKTNSLTPTQQKMIETLGFEGDTITITPTMVACAEDAVGKERLGEITNGAAPSPLESMKMLPCFKK